MKRDTALSIVPFAIWICLQGVLPATAWAYLARSLATFAALAALFRPARRRNSSGLPVISLFWAAAAGILVAGFWILPEGCAFYRKWVLWPFGAETPAGTEASPYNPAICGWALTLAKLAGSAFVIAPAEELFFRNFLYRWISRGEAWREARLGDWNWEAALWMAFVFSLEHSPRFAVAFLCGLCYQFAAKKGGLAAAIGAHAATNFILGVYVIVSGEWGFW